MPTVDMKIMGLLRRKGKVTLEELLAETGTSRPYLWRRIRHLESLGFIQRVQNGYYVLGPFGASDPDARALGAWGSDYEKLFVGLAGAVVGILGKAWFDQWLAKQLAGKTSPANPPQSSGGPSANPPPSTGIDGSKP